LRRVADIPVPVLAELLQRTQDSVEMRLYELGIYKRGEAPFSASRPAQFKARRRRWIISLACFFAAGILIGFAAGYYIDRSHSPPPEVARYEPQCIRTAPAAVAQQDACVSVATWNIRGYPERLEGDTAWFHRQLQKLGAEVLCIQEVANGQRLAQLMANEPSFTEAAYSDAGTGQDNAILAVPAITMKDLDAPSGFQHPVEIAFAAYQGFDAVIMTVHLAWDDSRRLDEMHRLEPLVCDMLNIDPDVMLVGDFNLPPEQAESLAQRLGMVVLTASNQSAVGTMYSGSSYDYFFLSPDLATEEAQGASIVTFSGSDLEIARRVSDHMPLLAFFACDERFRDRPLHESGIE
jgi:endonuclease/exonuclease/phosphatase family metal-dependent hydrolase